MPSPHPPTIARIPIAHNRRAESQERGAKSQGLRPGSLIRDQRALRIDQGHVTDSLDTPSANLLCASEWLPDHAQDLIEELARQSLELDQREHELVARELRLDARERKLRMQMKS